MECRLESWNLFKTWNKNLELVYHYWKSANSNIVKAMEESEINRFRNMRNQKDKTRCMIIGEISKISEEAYRAKKSATLNGSKNRGGSEIGSNNTSGSEIGSKNRGKKAYNEENEMEAARQSVVY
ncbi:hypothetical protein L2E82_19866 [Cichorium intybus]|uniref:Uncharacterized protein n=1 Tax=Cichorium intybus TaxID=13427 RepID=A0ACB9DRD1_CICIN|nr:hypothetical protein L2E82_19866 [Cichorium intybus]